MAEKSKTSAELLKLADRRRELWAQKKDLEEIQKKSAENALASALADGRDEDAEKIAQQIGNMLTKIEGLDSAAELLTRKMEPLEKTLKHEKILSDYEARRVWLEKTLWPRLRDAWEAESARQRDVSLGILPEGQNGFQASGGSLQASGVPFPTGFAAIINLLESEHRHETRPAEDSYKPSENQPSPRSYKVGSSTPVRYGLPVGYGDAASREYPGVYDD